MAKGRVTHEPAYLLKTFPYRETSLIAEFLTLNYGRITAVAKGAKRPMSQFKSILYPFQGLQISFSGGNAMKTLTKAEWGQGVTFLQGKAIFAGFYLNELCLLFLPKEDAHPAIFHAYRAALQKLPNALLEALFLFEKALLSESGYAPNWHQDIDGFPIVPHKNYRALSAQGFMAANEPLAISGSLLQAICANGLSEDKLMEGRKLLAYFLFTNHRLPKTLDLLAEVL
jgi:DNA repair protein RecO (recombination protein O)